MNFIQICKRINKNHEEKARRREWSKNKELKYFNYSEYYNYISNTGDTLTLTQPLSQYDF